MGKLPKYMEADSIKKKANRREDKVYKHLLSGALSYKGDFSTENSMIEHKGTEKKSLSVTTKMCEKAIQQSIEMGKENTILIVELPEYFVIGKVVKKSSI